MKIRFTPFQIAVHIGSWMPFAWLLWANATNRLTVNPIQAATQHVGDFAITFLVLSLACTPINTIFGFHEMLKVRRALGLYAFLYALLHIYTLVGLDYGFDLGMLLKDLGTKPYILVGAAGMLIILHMAITSFRWWMKRLGKGWKFLHRLVYLAAPLLVFHYAWAKKGNVFTLNGDITRPLLYGGILFLLLFLRIPFVVKWVVNLRMRIRHSIYSPRQLPDSRAQWPKDT